jgi:HNH endonuclease/NUMOD3 motif
MRKGQKMSATQLAARRERIRRRSLVLAPSVRLLKPDAQGYVVALLVNHPVLGSVRVYEHQLVFIEELGRPLTRGEQIHHINGIRHDNRRENLELMKSANEHKAKHPTIVTPEWRQHMSEAKKGKRPYVMTDEIRQHMSVAKKGKRPYEMTDEIREHMSVAKKGKRPYEMTDEIREHMSVAKKGKRPYEMTDEIREHMSAAKKGKRPYEMTDEIREHMSVAHKARQADPDLRKRTSDAMKAYRATVKQSGTGA